MIIAETNRMILRTWRESDIDALAAINDDPRVCQFLPRRLSRTETAEMTERFREHFDRHGFCLYAVELKSVEEMIGFVGLNVPGFEAHFMPAVEIGWRLASQHWNQGLATEAALAVVDLAFHSLGLQQLVSFTTKDNWQSRRVMEKIGMTYNPKDDFNFPTLDDSHPLAQHVLYRIYT